MVHKSTLYHFLLIITITHLHSHPLLPKSQLLTPTNHNTNGINIITSPTEVISTPTNQWNVNIQSQTTYQFTINLDQTWGFHPNITSSIKLTINSPSIATGPSTFDDIVFGFTTNNIEYISTWIPMDNNGQKNRIYPACDRSSNPTQSYGFGNIGILPNTNRNCDVAGGSCINWNTMYPKNAQSPNIYQYNKFPITFTLENNPITNTLFIYFNSIGFTNNFIQKCGFISMSTNEGLIIYIGGHENGQRFIINSFEIESFFNISDAIYLIENTVNENNINNTVQINDEILDLDEIDTESKAKISNIGIVIGVIIGLFVLTIIGALLHIKYGVKYKRNSMDNGNGINNNNKYIKNGIRQHINDLQLDNNNNNIRKYSLHIEGDDSEITGNDIRWHNLNVLPPNGNDDDDQSKCDEICDGVNNNQTVAPIVEKQYDDD